MKKTINFLKISLIVFFLSFFVDKVTSKDFTYIENGKLYFSNGEEMVLWGVNFQPNLSWEYNRLKKSGVQLNSSDLKKVTNESFDELELMNISSIRCHLTPADFVDSNGNIVETIYLDILDYMIAEAAKRDIYVTLAFINHMGNGFIENSMWTQYNRNEWMYNQTAIQKTKRYVEQLLNRINPYLKETYKETRNIAMWELINEPSVFSYKEIQNTVYYNDFLVWLKSENKIEKEQSYFEYGEGLVRNYINQFCILIRSAGAKQPLAWSLNWHRYMRGNEDVFKAVATSEIDVIAMCNYPGQDLVGEDYWNNPRDLTDVDYSDWFETYYNDITGYGWALSDQFSNKAKVVYEFETFFNQSSYLYPIQAQYFRALGAQAANMWTYSLSSYAPYSSGSHVLSLTCTPRKAASFIIANEIFKTTKLYNSFNSKSPNEQVANNYAISKERNLSIFADSEKLYYSGDITDWNPLVISNNIKEIIGYGNSSLVQYTGTGLYFIKEKSGKLYLTILPNVKHIQDQWDSRSKGLITELNYNEVNKMTISLRNWNEGEYTISQIKDGKSISSIHAKKGLKDIDFKPGDYLIVRD